MSTTLVAKPDSQFKIFGRDPVLYLEIIKYALAAVGVFLIPDLSNDFQVAILAVVTAALTLVQAFAAWPPVPTVFSGLVTAMIGLLVFWNVDVSANDVFIIQALLAAVMTMVLRGHTTPVVDPVLAGGEHLALSGSGGAHAGGATPTVDTADPPALPE